MRKRFVQFGVRQLALLIVLLCVLLVILAPSLQRHYVSREFERSARRFADAQTNLRKAVSNNDVALAQQALTDGADPNHVIDQKSSLHQSLLRRSIERGQIPIVELLLEFGADVEHIERLPGSVVASGPPLYAAIGCRQPTEVRLELIRLLDEYGADFHTDCGNRSAMDVAVYHADLRVAVLLRELGLPYGPREMAAFNQLEELRRVVERDPDVLIRRYSPLYAARPGQGPTLLGVALQHGYREMAEFLVESGAPLDTLEGLGQTPLHLAARGGDPQLIRLLIDQGLTVHVKDDHQDTPLTDSVGSTSPEAISALIEAGAEVNERGLNGRTALNGAVRAVLHLPEETEAFLIRLEVIRILLAAGADPTIPDRNGDTALLWARDNSPKVAKLLAEFQETEAE